VPQLFVGSKRVGTVVGLRFRAWRTLTDRSLEGLRAWRFTDLLLGIFLCSFCNT